MALHNGDPALSFGIVGGHFQPFGQCWLLSNMVDYGMTVQEAIDLPRAFAFNGKYRLEGDIPESTAAALDAMGHRTERWPLPLGSARSYPLIGQAVLLRPVQTGEQMAVPSDIE